MVQLRTKITLLNNMRLQQKSRMPMRSQAGSLQVRWIQKLLQKKKKAWDAACRRSLVGEMSVLFSLFCSRKFPEDQDPSPLLDFFSSNAENTHQSLLCMSTSLPTIHFYPAVCQVAHAAPCSLRVPTQRFSLPARRGILPTYFHQSQRVPGTDTVWHPYHNCTAVTEA